MKVIAVSYPELFPDEHKPLTALFENGLEILHLRKPGSTIEELSLLLKKIPSHFIKRIVLHDCFELAGTFPVKGLHINSRNNIVPEDFQGQLTTSCHSIEDVVLKKENFHYVFLSPVFDSISKQGYASSFSENQLKEAADQKNIDSKVIALGGVTPDKIPQLLAWQFGGFALLGYLWNEFIRDSDVDKLVQRFLKCKQNF